MKLRYWFVSLALVASPLLTLARPVTPFPTPPAQAGDEQALRDLVDHYAEALRTGNAEGLAVDLADDAVEMPPNAPAIAGKDAIREAYTELFDLMSYEEFDLDVQEIVPMGDHAWVQANYSMVLMSTTEVTTPFEDAGKYVILAARRADGSWAMSRMIYNSDYPG